MITALIASSIGIALSKRITSPLSKVTEQTNLDLNAAIEAARAGEAG